MKKIVILIGSLSSLALPQKILSAPQRVGTCPTDYAVEVTGESTEFDGTIKEVLFKNFKSARIVANSHLVCTYEGQTVAALEINSKYKPSSCNFNKIANSKTCQGKTCEVWCELK
ncbi:MAG: hypothetical protein BGO67_11000 [Alphaproteobacteria bacterium 41-28]|nr:MAG: hypothetical protein BGO67_11000 [Alphaproteobacteria bacterium 41-28]